MELRIVAVDMKEKILIVDDEVLLEVTPRVKTQLRRYVHYNNASGIEKEKIWQLQNMLLMDSINKNTHKCILYGNEVLLTQREFSVLWYLRQNRGKVWAESRK